MKHIARRRFGQNFLHDTQIIDDIVAAINPQTGERFVEIGPGRGALTLPLLEHDIDLHAVEIDRDLAQRWGTQASINPRFKVHCGDALEVDPAQLYADDQTFRLVGNLPYNISTPLLFHFVGWRTRLQDLHVMLQKEVVERMCATPGNKTYGRLTVMLAPHYTIENLLHVGGEAFSPPPKVDSAFVRLTPHTQPPFEVHDPETFKAVVSAAFSMRRKTLRNGLRALMDADQIAACDVDPGARAETLAPAQFAQLANSLAQPTA